MIIKHKNMIIYLNLKIAYTSANMFVDIDICGSCNENIKVILYVSSHSFMFLLILLNTLQITFNFLQQIKSIEENTSTKTNAGV